MKLTKQGYIRLFKPSHPVAFKDGTVLEHRMVWYDNFGSIPKGFQIHHINEDKTDNRIDNLRCQSNRNHQLEHQVEGSYITNQFGRFKVKPLSERQSTKKRNKEKYRKCQRCNKDFNMKRADAKFCSSYCQVTSWKSKSRGIPNKF